MTVTRTSVHHGARVAAGDLRRAGLVWGPLGAPAVVGMVAAGAAVVVVALRVAVAGHGDIGSFVLAGSRFVVPTAGHVAVPVIRGNGYDGQFYYRLALDPLNLSMSAHAIQLDSAVRFERITYPVLAWALVGGHGTLVRWSLVAVNVGGLGVLGYWGGILAKEGGRQAGWGLLLPGYFGFVWSLSRDLTEIVEATFLLAALLALRRERPWVAGIAFCGAVLSRETALVAVGCVAVVQVAQRWRERALPPLGRPRAVRAVAWVLPLGVFIGWQAAVDAATGQLPITASGAHNLGVPFVGMVRGVTHYASTLPNDASFLWFGEILVLVALVIAAARSFRSSCGPGHERAAWVAYGVMTVSLSPGIWLGDVGFRSLNDLYVFSCLVVLASPRRVRWVVPVMGMTWGIVAVELVKVL